MSYNPDIIFREAYQSRNNITKQELRRIRKSYNEWAREVREQSKYYQRSAEPGSQKYAQDLAQLYYQLRSASKQLTTEINTSIKNGVVSTGAEVARVNKRWLTSLGMDPSSIDKRYNPLRDSATRAVLSGNVYNNGVGLSPRVWQITDSNMKDIYNIVGRGIAEKQSINQISDQLIRYLNPDTKLGWNVTSFVDANGKTTYYRVHNSQVDYRASRLARTMIQHSYQVALVNMTKDNPFVKGYIWHADGSHPCDLCESRDGNRYDADDIPLDHPNGQCTIEPVISTSEIISELTDFGIDESSVESDIRRYLEDLDYRPW